MADDALRALERRLEQTGDPDDAERLRVARLRAARDTALVVDLRIELVTAPPDVAPDLRAAVAGRQRVVVDLSSCATMYSFVLGAVIAVHDELRRRGGHLVVSVSTPRILMVFDLLGIRNAIPIHPTVDDALRARGWTATETTTVAWRVHD